MDDEDVTIRPAVEADLAGIIALDQRNTGMAKPDYWHERFRRFGGRDDRFFLVIDGQAGSGQGGNGQRHIDAFIVGEVRTWEFGSPPCGWIFALGVDPDARLRGLASRLFDAICDGFRAAGVDKVRTMIAVDDNLNMSFFRSQGMMGGPFIELEKPLD
ncbi:MAG: GNAT family N-acetyltransferase [Hyphomicrobiales bacterium]|nr:GNAT family N-acetyltransferase [Hyphomicrobiales bacterium]